MVLRLLAFAVGVALVGWVLETAVRVVVLPRGARSHLTRLVYSAIGGVTDIVAGRTRRYETEDHLRSLSAPVGLLATVVSWLTLVFAAFVAMYWALDPDAGWGAAVHLSGSSITTLGFAPADGTAAQILAFIEAGLGLLLLALVIAYLPTIYGAFARREARVTLLEVRAGSPPSAEEFLVRYNRIGWIDRLDGEWALWEVWFTEIEESHTSHLSLSFFRSPDPARSWITAAGTILDAAALHAAALDDDESAAAGLCIRAGYIALRRIAGFLGIQYDPHPSPGDPISITRQEFADVLARLRAEGLPVRDDEERAWRDFAGWRVNYDTVLLAMAEIIHAPFAPWTADRSPPDHARPRVLLLGGRRRHRDRHPS